MTVLTDVRDRYQSPHVQKALWVPPPKSGLPQPHFMAVASSSCLYSKVGRHCLLSPFLLPSILSSDSISFSMEIDIKSESFSIPLLPSLQSKAQHLTLCDLGTFYKWSHCFQCTLVRQFSPQHPRWPFKGVNHVKSLSCLHLPIACLTTPVPNLSCPS